MTYVEAVEQEELVGPMEPMEPIEPIKPIGPTEPMKPVDPTEPIGNQWSPWNTDICGTNINTFSSDSLN